MELLLRLSSGLPREIREEAFFLIRNISKRRFLSACARGEALFVEQCLIHKKIDVSIYDFRPFRIAVLNNHPNVLSLLLEEMDIPSRKGERLLEIAIENGYDECISLLVANGVCATSSAIIDYIMFQGNLSILRILLEKDREYDLDIFLAMALIEGNREITEYLLSLGAEVDPREMEEIVSDELLELLRGKKRKK